ncbi:MAG: pyridoxal-phosphate dependent enzyme, partial [Gemmatimonadetes bacterium]
MTDPLAPFTPQALAQARRALGEHVHHTPLLSSRTLSERVGAPLWLKCENLQKTGAFKVRGALRCIQRLPAEVRAKGVVTVSAGNHAQATAWAAARAGTRATVVMPEGASAVKVEASRGYGARVELHGTAADAFRRAREIAEQEGALFLHPFDDPDVVAGHASVGLEIADDLPEAATVVVPVGGGGLISGVAVALAPRGVRVVGVEPAGAAAMRRSLDLGAPQTLEHVETIADGLAAPMAGALNFEIVRRLVDDVVLVEDGEIAAAVGLLLERAKLLVEPAGAAGVAALLAGRVPLSPGPV